MRQSMEEEPVTQPGQDDNGVHLQIHRTVMLCLDMHNGITANQILQCSLSHM